MRRVWFVLLIGLMTLLLSGCFRIEQEIDLTDGGPTAFVTTRLEVDKSFAGAEMDLFLDSLELSVPGLNTQATFRRFETTRDYSQWLVYEWEGQTKVAGDFSLTERSDGSYEFRYPVRKVDNLSAQSEASSAILRVIVRMPKAIDFANTMNIEGNTAIWDLTKNDLLRGVELRAITVAE